MGNRQGGFITYYYTILTIIRLNLVQLKGVGRHKCNNSSISVPVSYCVGLGAVREGFNNVFKVSSLYIMIRVVSNCMFNVVTYLATSRIITTTLAMTRNGISSSPTMKLTKVSITCWIEVAFGDNEGNRWDNKCFKWFFKKFRTFNLGDKISKGRKTRKR